MSLPNYFSIDEAAKYARVPRTKITLWFKNKYLVPENPDKLGLDDVGRIQLFNDLLQAGLTKELAGLISSDILVDGDNIAIYRGVDKVEFALGKFATLSINVTLLNEEVRCEYRRRDQM